VRRVCTSRDFTSANRTRSSAFIFPLSSGKHHTTELLSSIRLTIFFGNLFFNNMALKRKRSVMELNSQFDQSPQSTTSISSVSCRASTSPTPCPQYPRPMQLHIDRDASPYRAWVVGASNLAEQVGSRTRKRHRDNRPDEAIVHRRYLFRICNINCSDPVLSEPTKITHDRSTRHQPTLHAFWNSHHSYIEHLAAPPETMDVVPIVESDKCTHCDTPLQLATDAALGVPMDTDGLAHEVFGCRECGRLACDMCAVEMDRRICLECAINARDGDSIMH